MPKTTYNTLPMATQNRLYSWFTTNRETLHALSLRAIAKAASDALGCRITHGNILRLSRNDPTTANLPPGRQALGLRPIHTSTPNPTTRRPIPTHNHLDIPISTLLASHDTLLRIKALVTP